MRRSWHFAQNSESDGEGLPLTALSTQVEPTSVGPAQYHAVSDAMFVCDNTERKLLRLDSRSHSQRFSMLGTRAQSHPQRKLVNIH